MDVRNVLYRLIEALAAIVVALRAIAAVVDFFCECARARE